MKMMPNFQMIGYDIVGMCKIRCRHRKQARHRNGTDLNFDFGIPDLNAWRAYLPSVANLKSKSTATLHKISNGARYASTILNVYSTDYIV